jgi:hypothetical protein
MLSTLLPIANACIPRYSKHKILSTQQSLREQAETDRRASRKVPALGSNNASMQLSSNALRPLEVTSKQGTLHLAQPKKVDTQNPIIPSKCCSIQTSEHLIPQASHVVAIHADIRFGLLLLPAEIRVERVVIALQCKSCCCISVEVAMVSTRRYRESSIQVYSQRIFRIIP